MLGSSVTPDDVASLNGDGYSRPTDRNDMMVQPITMFIGTLPGTIRNVLFQFLLDDLQAPSLESHFQLSLNGVRIPSFEEAVSSIDLTGPRGQLLNLRLPSEYFDLLRSRHRKDLRR
jgi:hypothetical protein